MGAKISQQNENPFGELRCAVWQIIKSKTSKFKCHGGSHRQPWLFKQKLLPNSAFFKPLQNYKGSTCAVEEQIGILPVVICAYQLPQCLSNKFCLQLFLLRQFVCFSVKILGMLPSVLQTGVTKSKMPKEQSKSGGESQYINRKHSISKCCHNEILNE